MNLQKTNQMHKTYQELLEQEERLRKASEAYYDGAPIMSDSEFDDLWRGHVEARTKDPELALWGDTILDRVGSKPKDSSGFKKVRHLQPMLSLDNVFLRSDGDPTEELSAWLAKLDLGNMAEHCRMVAEPKIDGLSASVIYEDGVLCRVVTRGDGEQGDDITANAIAAQLVPLSIIPDKPFNGCGECRGVLEFRGEIYMPFDAFKELCAKAETNGEPKPANPRNAAAGIIRRKDPNASAGHGLRFMVHGIEHPQTDSYSDEVARVSLAGFSVPSRVAFTCGDSPRLVAVVDSLRVQPYPTDGIVFKLDSYKLRKALGFTARSPKWAVALKLDQEQVETIVSDITIQVGRSGALTPVAELVPVEVDGSVVSRATLHNETQVNRLGLQVGDTVVIQKAGGIIPEIVRVVGKPTRSEARFSLLRYIEHKCPSCGSHDILVDAESDEYSMVYAELKRKNSSTITPDGRLNLGEVRRQMQHIISSLSRETVMQVREANRLQYLALDEFRSRWLQELIVNTRADGLRYSCGNPGCPAKMAARIEHMASRGCLNIDQLGGELATALAEGKGLGGAPKRHPFELLDKEALWFARISWTTESGTTMTVGEARANKIRSAIESARRLPLNRWIAALGIPSIGENTSKEVSRLFRTPDELMDLRKGGVVPAARAVRLVAEGSSKDDPEIRGFMISHHLGPVSAKALVHFVTTEEGFELLSYMQSLGIVSENYSPIPPEAADGPLAGKTFCVTGTLSVPREEIHAVIQAAGGAIVSSVSKKTSVLIAGEKAGSKLSKARTLGVEVWTEQALRDVLS